MLADSTVKDLDDLHRKARASRSRLEPQWYLSLAYYTGEQWVAWDGRMLYRPQLPKNRITVVDNRIQPCVRTEIAKMSKTRPVFTVVPNTSDEMDTNAAEMGDAVMRYLWKHLNLHELTQKALHWSRICASSFFKVYWDPSKGESTEVLINSETGDMVTHPQTGAPMRPGSLPPLPGVVAKKIQQGDVCVEVRSPFQMYPDPLADTFDECEWLIEESVKSTDYVKRRYGVDAQPDTAANPGMVEARMGSVFLPGQASYKGVKVREYWCRPNATHPQGRRAVWLPASTDGKNKSTGKLLYEDSKPFDPMPYVMLSGIPVPGRLWPTSIVEQLRGPQTELNKVKSQIAENRNRVGNPTILASKQAVQDPEKFLQSTTVPGGVYFFDDVGSPNAVPQILQAPPLPEYVVEEIQRIEESIEQIAGQHEVTSAQVPPGVTAASAINLLQEADDTRLGPAMADYEHQLGKLGQKLLKHVARYYTDARTIRLSGDNGDWQIFDFRGSMLRENTHVEVQAGSAFPQSKAAKQASMQDLLTFFVQSGNPIQGRQLAQFLKDWEVGGAERLMEQYTLDEQQVNRENMLLAQGQPIQINEYDNDEAHLDGHTDFQKAVRYQQLPPNVQQGFGQHVEMHRQRLAQQQQAQMQLEMQQQGVPTPEQQQQQQQGELAQQQQQQAQDAQQQQQDLHGQAQQQQLDAAQQYLKMMLQGQQGVQQQDVQQAGNEQQRRQQEELHQQKLRHAEEAHQTRLRQQEEQARLQAEHARRQAQQRSEQETKNRGRRNQ